METVNIIVLIFVSIFDTHMSNNPHNLPTGLTILQLVLTLVQQLNIFIYNITETLRKTSSPRV